MLTMVKQPPKSRICGHCCVSMITGASLRKIIDIIGRKNGSETKEIIDALSKLGKPCDNKLRRVNKEKNNLPKLCILVCRYKNPKPWKWHWIIQYNGKIYDPLEKRPLLLKNYIKKHSAKITSFLWVK